jgi:hypothetical protein
MRRPCCEKGATISVFCFSPYELSSFCMAPVLKVLLDVLRIIRFAKDYIKRFPGRAASLLAVVGRKLIVWWRSAFGNFGHPKPAERPSPGTQASPYSVSSGSAIVREYVVSASHVPPSASHTSLHERTEGQPAAGTQTVVVHPPVPNSLSVDPSRTHNTTHPLGGRNNRSIGNLSSVSVQSRASDRFSIITNSRDSLRAPHGQPSRLPRGTHRQFGRGPDPSRSRERATRPSTPTTRPHTPIQPPRLEIITSNIPFPLHGDAKIGPVVQPPFQPPASSSYTHEPLSPPPSDVRRRQSATSVVVEVQNPSTESLPISTNPPHVTEEPFDMDSSTVHSSPDTPAGDLQDEPGTPTSTNPPTVDYTPTVDYFIPEGRFVQLINSDQIPRYEKGATMQVGYTIPL